ncbi:hypothetical protein L2E68_12240 [Planktothrix agardhii 1029]|uniref:hypothetical protein n=1 Tax=Planktothrix agardhii TaxID=1160 RepID=UPI001D09C487|nr:hypothetical protein [Planktothrix agardhii]MCB8751528.1 hypothetical protein [Planktothrix agardhii 1810]MCB8751803.1 hypothetical protein [Planktothrix agardhii 1810]MCB8763840.1 hypothetical protein [Planktothrix agardhii 1809]MCB8777473.1 hypothetical protein [Planktothrix agardhii 1031]MCB8781897.1 hypothetical protein [Planktothrix agardhii 1808]
MNEIAAQAASECGIPRLMLSRPAWEKVPGDHWIEVESNKDYDGPCGRMHGHTYRY